MNVVAFCRLFAAVCLLLAGCGRARVERVEWPVMGTVAAVQWRDGGTGGAVDHAAVRRVFSEVEGLLNAHDAKSEIRHLAHLPEDEILARCAPQVRPCYEAAFRLMRESDGAFNPRWRGTNTLDLGAIAKGFAVDLAAERLSPGGSEALIDLGGNLKVLPGVASPDAGWRTGVMSPFGNDLCARVRLMPGEAMATSAEYYRGKHIYDGRTNQPVTNGVASATVLCKSAMLADGLSTTLFVLGPADGLDFVRTHYADSVGGVLFVMADGTRHEYDPDHRLEEP